MSIMRSIRLPVTLVAAGLLIAGCAKNAPVTDTGPDAQVKEEQTGLMARAAISPDSAAVIAKGRVPGRIVEAELEEENGTLVYSFDIKTVGKDILTEVDIDAASGAILKVEPEN
jgi:uncharacterized membrane protein YkoI